MLMRGSETAALRELLEIGFTRDPVEAGSVVTLCRIIDGVELSRLPGCGQTKVAPLPRSLPSCRSPSAFARAGPTRFWLSSPRA